MFALNTSTVVVRNKSCSCESCFQNGAFSLNGSCDGWETHELTTSSCNEQSQVVNIATRSDTSPSSDQEEYNVGGWVSDGDKNDWYIGEIIETDEAEGDFHVSFL